MESAILSQETPVLLNGSPIPRIIYGTARREGKELPDVPAALETGYRAIDTATSRRFHHEDEDGRAIFQYLDKNTISVRRDDIFIQSKYAAPADQEEPWPYDIKDDARSRVFKSVMSCASSLSVDIIDVYFLSAPISSSAFDGTLAVWRALESIANRGGIRYLGICNVKIAQLRKLYEQAHVKPAFVQNWFRKAEDGYDSDVMGFCRDRGLVYQIFGVFDTENANLLNCEPVRRRANSHSVTNHQALLQMLLAAAAAQGLHLCILDGTTSTYHMEDNLKAVSQIEEISDADNREFLDLIGWTWR
ncbi:NADP-dependent oxidoreductase domain-containing protein [Hypoxylon rubiginosum]|uniref:NADP-dependent oxidoreductase domain-containing protein n=1 Tax=Hypoxylon rubiginosum TaxID=110542 RepID=A0ACC0DCT5_9PEZI|nr:NADP-dependent oxidoreductase domain-containing protein [Hypoxylon rubiginosum]